MRADLGSDRPPELPAPIGVRSPSEPSAKSPLPGSGWLAWRLRLLFLFALLACAGFARLTDSLAAQTVLPATWRSDASGRIELIASRETALDAFRGSVLASIGTPSGEVALPDALALQRSARWIVDDDLRARHPSLHGAIADAMAGERVRLRFADGNQVELQAERRGVLRLPALYWLFSLLALALAAGGTLVALGRCNVPSLLYAAMTWCQAGNLLFIAIQSSAEFGLPAWATALDLPLRQAFDAITAAAFVHLACLRPRRLPHAGAIVAAAWCGALLASVLGSKVELAHSWWWVQLGVALLGLVAIGLLGWSHSIEAHPYALMLRRLGIAAVGTWLLLSVGVGAASGMAGPPGLVVELGPTLWYVFLASLLLLAPMLSRSQHVVREFSLLAALSTIATSLDLLFVAVFSLGPFTSLTLSLFVSLAVYAGARQWILDRLLGNAVLTTERTFEHLYQTVREVERRPERAPALLAQLLRRLFEPIEVRLIDGADAFPSLTADGGSMTVPLPKLGDDAPTQSLLLRFAHHGRQLFTREDARLCERILDQIDRVLRFDHAVEQGRSEERCRLAQDLHDDIGARLLTLIYKAENPEIEDYTRHTLHDLKTLTRGLAASKHRLADAAAEWKVDLEQRLAAARVELSWRTALDADPWLGIGAWSALTRILRELVSNALAHAEASRVDIAIELAGGTLRLVVGDDGIGHAPAEWAAGLGLGGIRKRVRQLGGEVVWLDNTPRGIRCEVMVPSLDAASLPTI